MGGLYKTQEYLPSTSTVVIGNPASPVTAGSWQDVRGNSFDGVDRSVKKYEVAFDSSGGTAEVTNAYDGSGYYGFLTQSKNGVGQMTMYKYDADKRMTETDFSGTAPIASNRTYAYDPDGRTKAITDSTGTLSYAYDPDGNETQIGEPAGTNSANGSSTISFTPYPDGLREYLSIAPANGSTGGINQSNVFSYAYRRDGLLQTQCVTWSTAGTNCNQGERMERSHGSTHWQGVSPVKLIPLQGRRFGTSRQLYRRLTRMMHSGA